MSVGVLASGPRERDPRTTVLAAAGALAALAIAAGAAGLNPVLIMVPITLGFALAATHRWLLQWRMLVAIVIGVIIFIPMKRYTFLPGALPFQLEPYRLLIAVIAAGWLGTLLIDPRARVRRTGLDGPLLAYSATIFLSVAANAGRVSSLGVGDVVVKKLTFYLSFLIIVYLVCTTITRRREVDQLLKVLVGGGAIVAIGALIESRTGVNYFNRLHTIFPPLHFSPEYIPATDDGRGGRLRVAASAEHPIALSAALAMLFPLGVYLAKRTGKRIWWVCCGLLALGVISAVSRTGILMMVSILVTFLVLKPRSVMRAAPLLLPLFVAVHIAVPGAIGGLKSAFFPPGGLVAEQQYGVGQHGSGRLADLGPSLAEWSKTPIFGQGSGTRISDVDDPRQNAPILDNQGLGTLMETGAVGIAMLAWLFFRVVRRLGRFAKRDATEQSWLLAGLAASITAFGMGMFTFDAFAFAQVTFIFFILLGLSVAAMRPEATS